MQAQAIKSGAIKFIRQGNRIFIVLDPARLPENTHFATPVHQGLSCDRGSTASTENICVACVMRPGGGNELFRNEDFVHYLVDSENSKRPLTKTDVKRIYKGAQYDSSAVLSRVDEDGTVVLFTGEVPDGQTRQITIPKFPADYEAGNASATRKPRKKKSDADETQKEKKKKKDKKKKKKKKRKREKSQSSNSASEEPPRSPSPDESPKLPSPDELPKKKKQKTEPEETLNVVKHVANTNLDRHAKKPKLSPSTVRNELSAENPSDPDEEEEEDLMAMYEQTAYE